MAKDFEVAVDALTDQRTQLETDLSNLQMDMHSARISDVGVGAPHGRTILRELLEGAVGEASAHVDRSAENIGSVIARMYNLESQAEELDLELGARWTDLP